MTWFEDMIEKWRKEHKKAGLIPLNQYLHMTEQQAEKWTKKKPQFVAGTDEVGAGPLAGPLVVTAVRAPYNWSLDGLADSKDLCRKEGAIEEMTYRLYAEQKKGNIWIHTAWATNERIDEIGIVTCRRKGMCLCLDVVCSGIKDVMKIADGDLLMPADEISIPKADTFIPPVMAAAIIAKHTRDSFMKDMAEQYPGYGFETNVGYGSKEHYAGIEKLGPCPLHRLSFSPFKKEEEDAEAGHRQDHRVARPAHGATAQGQRDPSDADRDVQPEHGKADRARRKPRRKAQSGTGGDAST